MIPTNTDVTVSTKENAPANAEAIVVFSIEGKVGAENVGADEHQALQRLAAAGAARGKVKEVIFDIVQTSPGKHRRIFSVGLGKAEKITAETLRNAGGQAFRALRKHRLGKAAIAIPAVANISPADTAEAIVTGFLLSAFDYEEYKGTGQKKEDEPALKKSDVTVIAAGQDLTAIRSGVDRARIIADGQNFARSIASRPGNDINPPSLAKVAREMAREVGLTCRVMDENELTKLGMGGILAVGSGSIATPPRLIVLEHGGAKGKKGKKSSRPLLIVGKSITFDAGGISIKPADKMGKMIYDKCGGMAVLGLMYVLAKLKAPVHVVGILSSAENTLSSMAYRPGDILRMYNGVTVDVTNTDAEGRLVLGDALAWGIETYEPAAVVDLATLTGGVVTALGRDIAGVMSNNDALVSELNEAAETAGEKIWRLPLGEAQRDQIRADHADIVNSAGREASPLQGGAFLSFFVPTDGSVPWAHLDIAGVADTDKELGYYAKGATGWGVRTLLNWIEKRRP